MTASQKLQSIFRLAAAILMLLLAMHKPAFSTDSESLSIILAHAAWVQVSAIVCRNDAPEISGHLMAAYDDWRKRNTIIQNTLRELEFDRNAEEASRNRKAFARLKSKATAIYRDKREADPEDFSRACNAFTKELENGKWDYPDAKAPPR